MSKRQAFQSVMCAVIIAVIAGQTAASPVRAKDLTDLIDDGIDYYIPGDQCNVSGAIPDGGSPGNLDGHVLPAAKGGTGFEEPINAQGQVPSTGKGITFAENVRRASTEPLDGMKNGHPDGKEPIDPEGRSLQDLYRQYYITMRWRYVTWNWNGSSHSPGPETVDFYSKAPKVLVTNPKTGKSIIAVVLEAGPAPWTGIDGGNNNNAKQGWVNPQDGTPPTYKGRVSGFPPRAIADLGATQRQKGGTDSPTGDDLLYQWAPDQNALPGPVSGPTNVPTGTDPNAACSTEGVGGSGDVNADGIAFPVADQKKHGYGTLPCNNLAKGCHHGGNGGQFAHAAFDLMYGGNEAMSGRDVYAITDGTIYTQKVYRGVTGCYSIQFKSDKGNGNGGYYYWYGHLQNPQKAQGEHVTAGTKIAEVARTGLGPVCHGRDPGKEPAPHLHIDRGCVRGSIPQTGGGESCRDEAFVRVLQTVWEQLGNDNNF